MAPLLRPFFKYNVIVKKLILISAHSYIAVLIKYIELLAREDYMFKLVNRYLVILFIAVVNLSFYTILIYNNLDKLINLPSKFYINLVIDIEIDRYYYLNNFKKA